MRKINLTPLTPLLLAALLASCGGEKILSDKEYAERAREAMQGETYDLAIDNLQKLLEEYPFSEYSEEAQLKIGHAQYLNKQYTEAIASFQDFQRMHPTSPNLAFTEYYLALSYYDQMGKRDRDQRAAQNAQAHLQAVIDRYRDTPFAEQAREKLRAVRELLAEHEFGIAKFYITWLNPLGAEARLKHLIETYPDTTIAAQALLHFGRHFRKRGDLTRAALAYATIVDQYGQSGLTSDAKRELDELRAKHIEVPASPLGALLETLGRPGAPAAVAAAPEAAVPAATN